ncbi:MAG: thioredoxin family protein [Gemmatimonadaceae bacterium]|nr:thioredoxin family protein [Gemmatimonadaceae bacterium]
MLVPALALSFTFALGEIPAALRCEVEDGPGSSAAHAAVADPVAARAAIADSTLRATYESGVTWDSFLADARARRALWLSNWERALVPADALAQARALPGRWLILAIALDACSDSVNTIPYLAKLAEEVPALDIRIVHPDAARGLMAARRTPDGRAATPTVILLDLAGNEVGCWVERPAELQRRAIEARAGGGTSQFASEKQGWYDRDAGASTVREVVALLAAAAGGARGCDAGGPSSGL